MKLRPEEWIIPIHWEESQSMSVVRLANAQQPTKRQRVVIHFSKTPSFDPRPQNLTPQCIVFISDLLIRQRLMLSTKWSAQLHFQKSTYNSRNGRLNWPPANMGIFFGQFAGSKEKKWFQIKLLMMFYDQMVRRCRKAFLDLSPVMADIATYVVFDMKFRIIRWIEGSQSEACHGVYKSFSWFLRRSRNHFLIKWTTSIFIIIWRLACNRFFLVYYNTCYGLACGAHLLEVLSVVWLLA